MSEKISKWIKVGSKNFKQLRDSLKKLKAERAKMEDKPGSLLDLKPHSERKTEVLVQFSLLNIAKATIVVLLLLALSSFLEQISQILLVFFIAILFSAALSPTVRAFEKRRIPRPLSVIGLFLVLALVLGFFVSQLVPLVASQLVALAHTLSSLLTKLASGETSFNLGESFQSYLQNLLANFNQEMFLDKIKSTLEGISKQLESFAGNTFKVIKTAFDGILNFVLVMILTFFMIVNEKDVHNFFVSLFPMKHGAYIVEKIEAIQEKIGYWLRGQVVLMLIMFGLSLIGLLILGIDNALTLAMMVGIAELIPVVGPVLAGVPAMLVAFNQSPWLAVWVLGLIFILHQIEGNVLVPLVMRRAVGLNPIIVILAMMMGLQALGIVGMILAIPVATALSIFVKEYAQKQK